MRIQLLLATIFSTGCVSVHVLPELSRGPEPTDASALAVGLGKGLAGMLSVLADVATLPLQAASAVALGLGLVVYVLCGGRIFI